MNQCIEDDRQESVMSAYHYLEALGYITKHLWNGPCTGALTISISLPRSLRIMHFVDYFEKQGRVVKVQATKSPEDVYKEMREKLEARLGKNF